MCSGECTALTEIEPTACLGSSDCSPSLSRTSTTRADRFEKRVCCDKSRQGCL